MEQDTLEHGSEQLPGGRSPVARWLADPRVRRGLSVVGVLAVATAVVSNLRPDPPAAHRSDAASSRLPQWPVRGELAASLGDDLLGGGAEAREARRLVDRNPGSRVLFAGRVGASTVLVAALPPAAGFAGITAVADIRDSRGDWHEASLASLDAPTHPGEPSWFVDFPDGARTDVLYLGPPERLAVELSTSLGFATDGTVSRVWQRVTTSDGAVRTSLGTGGSGQRAGLRARVVGTGDAGRDAEPTDLPVSSDAVAGPYPGDDLQVRDLGAAAALDPVDFPRVVQAAVRRMVVPLPGPVTARLAWTGRASMADIALVTVHADPSANAPAGVDAQVWVSWRPSFDIRVEALPAVGMRVLPAGTTQPVPFVFFGPGDNADNRRHWTYVDPSGSAGWMRSGRTDFTPALADTTPGVLVEIPAPGCRDDPRACPLLVRTNASGVTLHDGPVGDLLGTPLP